MKCFLLGVSRSAKGAYLRDMPFLWEPVSAKGAYLKSTGFTYFEACAIRPPENPQNSFLISGYYPRCHTLYYNIDAWNIATPQINSLKNLIYGVVLLDNHGSEHITRELRYAPFADPHSVKSESAKGTLAHCNVCSLL